MMKETENSTNNAIEQLRKIYLDMLENGYGREVPYEESIRKEFLDALIRKLDPIEALAEFQETQNGQ